MSSEFVIWSDRSVENSARLTGLAGLEREWTLFQGMHLAPDWANVSYEMDPNYPEDIALFDGVANIDQLVIVSKELREFFVRRDLQGVEFLPITIRDQRGRVASQDHVIVNPYPLQDAIDMDASEVTYDRLRPTDIAEVERLVIDPARVDPKVGMFRLFRFTRVVVVRRSLAEAITAEGFRGMRWIPVTEYPEG